MSRALPEKKVKRPQRCVGPTGRNYRGGWGLLDMTNEQLDAKLHKRAQQCQIENLYVDGYHYDEEALLDNNTFGKALAKGEVLIPPSLRSLMSDTNAILGSDSGLDK